MGGRKGDSGGGSGGNTWGGGGKNKRSDGPAMFGNRWLPNIAIIILIISKHYKAHPVGWTKFKIQTVGTVCTNTLLVLLFL